MSRWWVVVLIVSAVLVVLGTVLGWWLWHRHHSRRASVTHAADPSSPPAASTHTATPPGQVPTQPTDPTRPGHPPADGDDEEQQKHGPVWREWGTRTLLAPQRDDFGHRHPFTGAQVAVVPTSEEHGAWVLVSEALPLAGTTQVDITNVSLRVAVVRGLEPQVTQQQGVAGGSATTRRLDWGGVGEPTPVTDFTDTGGNLSLTYGSYQTRVPVERLYAWTPLPFTNRTVAVASTNQVFLTHRSDYVATWPEPGGVITTHQFTPEVAGTVVPPTTTPTVLAVRGLCAAEVVLADGVTRRLRFFAVGLDAEGHNRIDVLEFTPVQFTAELAGAWTALAHPFVSTQFPLSAPDFGHQLSCSHDGTRLAVAARDALYLFRAAHTGSVWYLHRRLSVPGLSRVALSGDGQLLVWTSHRNRPQDAVATTFLHPLENALTQVTLTAAQAAAQELDVARVQSQPARYLVVSKQTAVNGVQTWLVGPEA